MGGRRARKPSRAGIRRQGSRKVGTGKARDLGRLPDGVGLFWHVGRQRRTAQGKGNLGKVGYDGKATKEDGERHGKPQADEHVLGEGRAPGQAAASWRGHRLRPGEGAAAGAGLPTVAGVGDSFAQPGDLARRSRKGYDLGEPGAMGASVAGPGPPWRNGQHVGAGPVGKQAWAAPVSLGQADGRAVSALHPLRGKVGVALPGTLLPGQRRPAPAVTRQVRTMSPGHGVSTRARSDAALRIVAGPQRLPFAFAAS
jgi:hypothetical protein